MALKSSIDGEPELALRNDPKSMHTGLLHLAVVRGDDPVISLESGQELPSRTRDDQGAISYCQANIPFLTERTPAASNHAIGMHKYSARHTLETRQRTSTPFDFSRTSSAGSTPSSFTALYPTLLAHHHHFPAMDAFFTITSPVPVDEPSIEEILVDSETTGSGSSHSGCVIA